MTPQPGVVCQVQGGPTSQGKNIQRHHAREEGRGGPRRAGSSLKVEEWDLLNFGKVGEIALSRLSLLLLRQRLCGNKLMSFCFYFIFKIKKGKGDGEERKEEWKEGRTERQGHIVIALEARLHLVTAISPARLSSQKAGTGLSHHLLRALCWPSAKFFVYLASCMVGSFIPILHMRTEVK